MKSLSLISKSRYLAGLQCPKRLWLETHRPELAPPRSPAVERVLSQGREVGLRARELFPSGILLEEDPRLLAEARKATRKAVEEGARVLFEATFVHGEATARTDILVRNEDGTWDLLEVKASTKVKPEHVPDLALQVHVCEGAGLAIRRAVLLHLNRDCRHPDLSNLFLEDDLSEPARRHLPSLEGNLARFRDLLDRTEEPEVRLGSHCFYPGDCPFFDHCARLWKLPDPSVFDIPHLAAERRDALIERGILSLEDVPPDTELGGPGERFLRLYRDGTREIDLPGIRAWLSALRFPIHFLDFETDAPAIPRLPGLGPYGKIPFQFSLHVLSGDGRLEEAPGFLHQDPGDPRPGIARALLEQIGDEGSLVAYNAPFENGVIRELALALPDLAEPLDRLTGRFADLLDVFRNHYFDPAFKGSNSIKNVLPVLCPDLSYAGLDVRNGQDAQAAWARLIATENPEEKGRLSKALKEYCGLDTMAMVRLYRSLGNLAD